MRKQTKLVAVLSTAALLAIGASMTSFAATGWVEEDGTWVYYDRDEERVTDEWRRSGDNWFYLNSDGEMAADQLIEDDDDYYYVNESGAMVTNQWVAIENEDAGDEDEPDYYWYYFQANGKAYKRPDSASEDSIAARTINGKRYAFDEEGRMLFGWVDGGERQTDDDAWRESDYYFGDENDGAMAQGWVQISIVDDAYEDNLQPGDEFWDEDQDRWFYFQSSGRKVKTDEDDIATDGENALKQRTINGRRYGFDQYGRMVASWYTEGTLAEGASQNDATYSSSFMYFSDPEDGARMTRGWFRVVPGYYLEEDEYNDGEDYWYYADGSGNLYANEIRTINGRRYAFNQNGRMLDGLVLLQMAPRENSNSDSLRFESTEILRKWDDDGDLPYDTEDNFDDTVSGVNDAYFIGESGSVPEALSNGELRFCYFGDSDDGSMKTGRQTVEIDGEDFTFRFRDSSSTRGASIHGMDDHRLYNGGKMFRADSDDRYRVVIYTEYGNGTIHMEEMDADDFIDEYCEELTDTTNENYDEDETRWDVVNEDDEGTYEADGEVAAGEVAERHLYLVNTSGSMVRNDNSAKDGDDYEFEVDDYEIVSVTLEN